MSLALLALDSRFDLWLAGRVQPLEAQTSLPEVDYSGRGERLARVVADIIQGGQVVLTEAAWAHVQDQLPGQAQVRRLFYSFAVGHGSFLAPR